MSKSRKELGPYIPKDKIAYWFPVSHDEAEIIEMHRDMHLGNGEHFAPYQLISRSIRTYRPHEQEES